MPWFQSLLFEYKSSASSVVAEYKRVEVNILLVAVCSTFSIVKLVFGSFFNKTRWWLLVVKLSDTWKVLSCQSAFGLCYLTLKWYTKILLILHWFDADWTRMITLFDHLPFWKCCVQHEVTEAFRRKGKGEKDWELATASHFLYYVLLPYFCVPLPPDSRPPLYYPRLQV